MMHGYMAFDKEGNLLVPFRTCRNSTTGQAAKKLTELFDYNIPKDGCIAHLYQAVLNGEEHVKNIDYVTTLAGYIHWKMTGEKVLGIGDVSGMFPIDSEIGNYQAEMVDKFDDLLKEKNYPWKLEALSPNSAFAGEKNRGSYRRRSKTSRMKAGSWNREFLFVLRKGMPVQEWLQRTV